MVRLVIFYTVAVLALTFIHLVQTASPTQASAPISRSTVPDQLLYPLLTDYPTASDAIHFEEDLLPEPMAL